MGIVCPDQEAAVSTLNEIDKQEPFIGQCVFYQGVDYIVGDFRLRHPDGPGLILILTLVPKVRPDLPETILTGTAICRSHRFTTLPFFQVEGYKSIVPINGNYHGKQRYLMQERYFSKMFTTPEGVTFEVRKYDVAM